MIFIAGETVKQCKAVCTVTGEIGNGYLAGELRRVVDPQAFLLSIVNVTTSEGGADVESDDNYRERIHEAPEAFSCAGSEGAYNYHAKSTSQLIRDVVSVRTAPGVVTVYPLLKGGELPQAEMLSAVDEYLSAKTIRPLTDNVIVTAPTVVNYNLTARYYVSRSDAIQAAAIEEAATQAVQDYIEWQRSKLGRDINPSEIIYRLKQCGVKRVEVTSPTFRVLAKNEVAIPNSTAVTFAGLEDD